MQSILLIVVYDRLETDKGYFRKTIRTARTERNVPGDDVPAGVCRRMAHRSTSSWGSSVRQSIPRTVLRHRYSLYHPLAYAAKDSPMDSRHFLCGALWFGAGGCLLLHDLRHNDDSYGDDAYDGDGFE